MFHSVLRPGFRRIILVIFGCCLSICGTLLSAQTPAPPSPPQDAPANPDSTTAPLPTPATGQNEEVSSQETPTTFKVRVNLVLVRVVVRDSQGKVVSNELVHERTGRKIFTTTGDYRASLLSV